MYERTNERTSMLIDREIDRPVAGRGGGTRGERRMRKPGIVVDCARQLGPNNRPPFLAERLL